MTLTLGGDRIKVTVLEFVDPAVVDNPGLDTLFDRLADGAASGELLASPEEPRDVRYAAVQVKTRNLDPAIEGSACIVHVALSGFLIDADGNEHSAGMASIKGGGRATPPQRGEPSAIGSIAFRLPNGAVPRSFVLSYSGARKAQWSLEVDAAVDDAPGATEAPLDVLRQGVGRWNEWREAHPQIDINLDSVDFRKMDLTGANLSGVNLRSAQFQGATLEDADLRNAFAEGALFIGARMQNCNLTGARLAGASFHEAYAARASFRSAGMQRVVLEKVNAIHADFSGADLRHANAVQAGLAYALFVKADLSHAKLWEAIFLETDLRGAYLHRAEMNGICLADSNLCGAKLHAASVVGGNLQRVDLTDADVRDCDLSLASMVGAKLTGAVLSNCRIFGVAAWAIEGQPKLQDDLVITPDAHGRLTVNDLEIAQFIYLLLNYKQLQKVFNSMTERGVLILGRFGGGGVEVLREIADELRAKKYIPIIFEFGRPDHRNLTETVKTLVGLSRFVIVDLSGPSVPQELTATVPHFKIPFVPIIERGARPYSMFADLLEYDWVLKPIVDFTDVPSLLADLPARIVAPAEARVKARQALLRELFIEANQSSGS